MSSNLSGGVTQLEAGTNITLTPAGGTGMVTIAAAGGGGGGGVKACSSAVHNLGITSNGAFGLVGSLLTNASSEFASITDPALGVNGINCINFATAGNLYRITADLLVSINTSPSAAGILEIGMDCSDGGGATQQVAGSGVPIPSGQAGGFYLSLSSGFLAPTYGTLVLYVIQVPTGIDFNLTGNLSVELASSMV